MLTQRVIRTINRTKVFNDLILSIIVRKPTQSTEMNKIGFTVLTNLFKYSISQSNCYLPFLSFVHITTLLHKTLSCLLIPFLLLSVTHYILRRTNYLFVFETLLIGAAIGAAIYLLELQLESERLGELLLDLRLE